LSVAYAERLAATLPRVRDQVAGAAAAAGRDPGGVRLVAVTKGHPLDAVRAALAAGLSDLGENRVEELDDKAGALGGAAGVRWHMIGHLQSRKAKRAVELAQLIHSVDSLKLAERLARAAQEAARTVWVLAQVNTSGEAAKQGLSAAEAEDAVLAMAGLNGLRVEGLMTMAPLTDDARVQGETFGRLRELLGRIRGADARVGGELSMGMTNDLAVAVREGSTMVRIGTALFGERG
jgi:pyridoxal phosphate enzyme (YggS family)